MLKLFQTGTIDAESGVKQNINIETGETDPGVLESLLQGNVQQAASQAPVATFLLILAIIGVVIYKLRK